MREEHRQSGYTLLEILFTVAIVAVLVAVVVPTFKTTITRSSIQSLQNSLKADLAFARSEAVSRNSTVTLCNAADGSGDYCNGTVDFSVGWIIFIDDGAGDRLKRGNSVVDSGEPILIRRMNESSNSVVYSADPVTGKNAVTFSQRGYLDGVTQKAFFRICPADGEDKDARGIYLDFTGRSAFSRDIDADPRQIHDDNLGSNLSCS